MPRGTAPLIILRAGFIKAAQRIERGKDMDSVVVEWIGNRVGDSFVQHRSPGVSPYRRVPLAIVERARGHGAAHRGLAAAAAGLADGGPGIADRSSGRQ